jgi:hypothetical protein
MQTSKLIVMSSVGALIVGFAGFAATSFVCGDAQAKDMVIAAEDDAAGEDADAPDSAKMGQHDGTDSEDDQGATPGSQSGNADHPDEGSAGEAPDQEGDDVMPPEEDSEDQAE